ncbi:S-layer homology domain-containing protein [Paenibacillus sp. HW567]|uniref:S-layer homology domain-containing protein n=1 Tax=Paenibacillus sp. HW567 TaxID=1034769 RepID=UPI0003614B04|nr:S-layer homology domain-containing protein [Paenibacillus sp. HW567]
MKTKAAKNKKKLFTTALGLVVISSSFTSGAALAAPSDPSIALPKEPAWGYFVDQYKKNVSANMTVDTNPALGTLSKFLDLWTPGNSWDNGTELNGEVLDYNIEYVANIAKTRTKAEEDAAYYTDRTNQTYGAVDGLGSLADVYRDKSGTFTTIKSIPEDATKTKYTDGNDSNKAGDSNSELGKMVDLIGIIRGNYASTSPSKSFYQYKRPFRWKDTSIIVPTLVPVISDKPSSDGGFPSGHTNASYLAALALAYAVPERFQELVTRASEMGNNRIVAGMHSPLDVMGGRVLATALAASALADPDNQTLKQEAYNQAHSILLKQTGTAEDRFTDYEKNKAEYTQRLTYGFKQIGSTTVPVAVPKGAEVLLETRQPYLSADQRRAVLATTGIASGYPLLDDPEGWGRLNLFAAADGYGAFNSDVTVAMDAGKGGFNALDKWRNNISGTGKLTKEGSGTLKLQGINSYSGGTEVNAGTLEGDTASAFGSGNVVNSGGTVTESVYGKWNIEGKFTQAAGGTLELNMATANDVLDVKGAVSTAGTLRVNFTNGYVPAPGVTTLVSYGANQQSGTFASVQVNGLPSQYNAQVVYESNRIALVVTDTTNPGTSTGTGSAPVATPTPTPTPAPSATSTGAAPTPGAVATPPAAQTTPFKSGVVSQETVLKTVNEAIAATKNEQKTLSDISGHWANRNIGAAVKLRIIDGYENGSFRPNASVTRAEFTAMIARAFGFTESSASSSFKDARSSWAAGYISTLADKGIISGYADGSFKPNAPISRAEMVTILARVLDLNVLGTSAPVSFSDVNSGYWAAEAIAQASSANLVQGLSASAFSPNGKATRAEAVTIIIRALESDSSVKALIQGL